MSTSDLLDCLSERRRRCAVYALFDADGPLTVEELATRVAECEGGRTDPTQVERVQLTLVHNHLLRLVDAGLVVYDESSGTVTPASVTGPVRDLVDAARALDTAG